MLTGEHPFPDTSLTALLDHHVRDVVPSARSLRPQLPPAVDEVIGRATAKDPDDALRGRRGDRDGVREPRSKGPASRANQRVRSATRTRACARSSRLTPWTSSGARRSSSGSFRPGGGRSAQRFLAVVGPSGSGKSSVVRAGLVPALRRGAIPGSERWYVIDVVPGLHPFRELETALMAWPSNRPHPSWRSSSATSSASCGRSIACSPTPRPSSLIVLDQLEEVFTMVEDDSERARFLASIEAAALQPDSRVRMIATLRADFYDAAVVGSAASAICSPLEPKRSRR